MWRMIQSTDLDLAAAIRTGDISFDELGAMMRTCTFCPERCLCRLFLDAREGETGAVPSYCPLGERVAELTEIHSKSGPCTHRLDPVIAAASLRVIQGHPAGYR